MRIFGDSMFGICFWLNYGFIRFFEKYTTNYDTFANYIDYGEGWGGGGGCTGFCPDFWDPCLPGFCGDGYGCFGG